MKVEGRWGKETFGFANGTDEKKFLAGKKVTLTGSKRRDPVEKCEKTYLRGSRPAKTSNRVGRGDKPNVRSAAVGIDKKRNSNDSKTGEPWVAINVKATGSLVIINQRRVGNGCGKNPRARN